MAEPKKPDKTPPKPTDPVRFKDGAGNVITVNQRQWDKLYSNNPAHKKVED